MGHRAEVQYRCKLFRTIEQLYDEATSVVQMNGSIGEWFRTDDTDALAEEEQAVEALDESLDKTCTKYQMEIRAEKTKLMAKSANGIHREITVKEQKLGTVTSFNYL